MAAQSWGAAAASPERRVLRARGGGQGRGLPRRCRRGVKAEGLARSLPAACPERGPGAALVLPVF